MVAVRSLLRQVPPLPSTQSTQRLRTELDPNFTQQLQAVLTAAIAPATAVPPSALDPTTAV
jgi:hypothetical protein